jgi:hypothetical protein
MLVPGLPITPPAVESIISASDRLDSSAGARPSRGPGSLRESVRAWRARLLFAACYLFLVGVVAMAG